MRGTDIDIFAFEDAALYLQERFRSHRNRRVLENLRGISQRAGLRSPSLLSMILSGKRRLTEGTAAKLAVALKLEGIEKRYFLALVKKQSAKTIKESTESKREVMELRRHAREIPFRREQYRCLSIWFYPVILSMTGKQGIPRDPEKLVRQLGRGVTRSDCERAIQDLLCLGLLRENGSRLFPTASAFRTEGSIAPIAMRRYHQKMLAFARDALRLPLEERHISGLTLSVPESRLEELRGRIDQFRSEINEHFSAAPESKRVFQLNVQFFPLTQRDGQGL